MSKFALLFLMVFLGGIVAALVYSGTAAFLVYQLVYFLNPDARWWSAVIPGLRYSMITALLMILVLMIKYREYSQWAPWAKMPVFKYLIALVLLYYLAYLFAVNLPPTKRLHLSSPSLRSLFWWPTSWCIPSARSRHACGLT